MRIATSYPTSNTRTSHHQFCSRRSVIQGQSWTLWPLRVLSNATVSTHPRRHAPGTIPGYNRDSRDVNQGPSGLTCAINPHNWFSRLRPGSLASHLFLSPVRCTVSAFGSGLAYICCFKPYEGAWEPGFSWTDRCGGTFGRGWRDGCPQPSWKGSCMLDGRLLTRSGSDAGGVMIGW